MGSGTNPYATNRLRQAHAMAQATHLWVRQQVAESDVRERARLEVREQALAAGLIAGLIRSFLLENLDAELVAYVYCLMTGARREALSESRRLLEIEFSPSPDCGFNQGLAGAEELVETLYLQRQRPDHLNRNLFRMK